MHEEATAKDVASFMKAELDKDLYLFQDKIGIMISQIFGNGFINVNEKGSISIDRKVLREFRKLTPDVVWERGVRCWRRRVDSDVSKK